MCRKCAMERGRNWQFGGPRSGRQLRDGRPSGPLSITIDGLTTVAGRTIATRAKLRSVQNSRFKTCWTRCFNNIVRGDRMDGNKKRFLLAILCGMALGVLGGAGVVVHDGKNMSAGFLT